MLKPFFLIDSPNFKKTSSFITESKSWYGMLVSFAGYSTYSLGREKTFLRVHASSVTIPLYHYTTIIMS